MAEITLADINKTLIKQVDEQHDTNGAITSLVSKISAQMEGAEKDRLIDLNAKPTRLTNKVRKVGPNSFKDGLKDGLGLGFLDSISNTFKGLLPGLGLGSLLGAGGKILGKTILAGIVGAAFAHLAPEFSEGAGEWLMNGMKAFGMPTDWYDKMPQDKKDAMETALGSAGLGLLSVVLLPSLTKFLLKGAWSLALAPLGRAVWKGLKGVVIPKSILEATTKATTKGTQAAIAAAQRADDIATAAAKAAKNTPTVGRGPRGRFNKLPKPPSNIAKATAAALDKGKAGTPRPKNLMDALKVAEASKQSAKYAKALKFVKQLGAMTSRGLLPTAIALNFVDPILAIANNAPEDEIKKQLAGALGSLGGGTLGFIGAGALSPAIPVVGQSGIGNLIVATLGGVAGALSGEYLAEGMADFLLGGDAPEKRHKPQASLLAKPSPVGAATFSETGVGDLNPFGTGNSFTNGRQPAIPASVEPMTGISGLTFPLIQRDRETQVSEIEKYLATVGTGSGRGGNVSMDDNSSTVTNNNTGMVMPSGSTSNLLDDGLALGN